MYFYISDISNINLNNLVLDVDDDTSILINIYSLSVFNVYNSFVIYITVYINALPKFFIWEYYLTLIEWKYVVRKKFYSYISEF